MESVFGNPNTRSWNKGKLVGQKASFKIERNMGY